MSTAADIFLSYNREDLPAARRFAEGFEREGLGVWWDQTLRSGEAYDQVTEKALREAKAVVVLWSKKSVESRWVRAEATLADRKRNLVPVMIEPCERPIMFELTQTADLFHWNGDMEDRAWQSFLDDVRRFVGANAVESAAALPQLAAVSGRAAQDGRPSLAILPFTNRSGELADNVFADGMVEDLISALSYSSGLKVIAQSATITYRRNLSDLRTIGRELGVRYLLEGNVRRVSQSLRVTAQLVEAESANILWTQRFERPLSELAALQEQLVMEVAGHLNVQVERLEIERALKKPEKLTAWEAVMRAMANGARMGPSSGSMQTAIEESRRAVRIDPDFALGHATLAYFLGSIMFNIRGMPDASWLPEARAEATRALSLDGTDPAVLTRVAWALGICGQWNEALNLARRALELNPNSAFCRETIASLCIRHLRPEEALEHLDAELILAPRSYRAHMNSAFRALAHFQARRYEQALQAVEHCLSLFPDFVYAWKDKAVYLEALGRHEEAREAIRWLRTIGPLWTLEDIHSNVDASFIAPQTASEMNELFSRAWRSIPVNGVCA